MKTLAHLFYGLAAAGLVIVIVFNVSYANEYGWDWSATSILNILMWVGILAGLPFWIGSLFHRKARSDAATA